MLNYEQLLAYIDGLNIDGLSPQNYIDIINYILANGDIENSPRDLIQVRRGSIENLPLLAQGELAFTLDTKEFFIGGLDGNVKLTTEIDLQNHINNLENPHEVTKLQIGLENVENLPIANEQQAIEGSSNELYMTPLRTKQLIDDSTVETPTQQFKLFEMLLQPDKFKETRSLPNGDVEELIKLKLDNSLYATFLTQFDTPTQGDITQTLICPALNINNVVVTTFENNKIIETGGIL